MLSLTFCTKWILLGGLFSILVLGGDTNTIRKYKFPLSASYDTLPVTNCFL